MIIKAVRSMTTTERAELGVIEAALVEIDNSARTRATREKGDSKKEQRKGRDAFDH